MHSQCHTKEGHLNSTFEQLLMYIVMLDLALSPCPDFSYLQYKTEGNLVPYLTRVHSLMQQAFLSFIKGVGKGVGGGGGGDGWGLHPSPDLKLMLLCVQVFTAKGRPKISKITREETNSFQVISSVTHTQIKA